MGTTRNKEHAQIAERFRRFRIASGLTQQEFAGELQVGQTQIGNIEAGKTDPSVDLAIRICRVRGLTLDYVFQGSKAGLADSVLEVIKKAEALEKNAGRRSRKKAPD